MSSQATVEVIVLCVCVVLSALASGTETALTSVGRLRVRHLAEEGSKAAAKLQKLQADPNRFLSTVLFVNTVALIVASSMSTLVAVAITGGRAARAPYLSEQELLTILAISEEQGVIEEEEREMIHGIIEIGDT